MEGGAGGEESATETSGSPVCRGGVIFIHVRGPACRVRRLVTFLFFSFLFLFSFKSLFI